jgi:YD repeat-containing protein
MAGAALIAVLSRRRAQLALGLLVSLLALLTIGLRSPTANSISCPAYTGGSAPEFSPGRSTSILSEAGLREAYEYGCQWGQSNNEKYFTYNEDSADFVSQLLKTGGVKRTSGYKWNDQEAWFSEEAYPVSDGLWGSPPLHSQSWSSSSDLYHHLLESGEGVLAPEQTEAATSAGDLIFWNWNPVGGNFNDVSMVVSGDGANPSTEVVASHIPDSGDPNPEKGDSDDGINGSHDEVNASLPGLTNMSNLLSSLGPYLSALTKSNSEKYEYQEEGQPQCPSSDPGTGGSSGTCWNWVIVRLVKAEQPAGPNAPGENTGADNPSEDGECQPCNGDPVDAATGEFVESATDFSIPGRGPMLNLSRTYGSLVASNTGPFGYGWTDSYNMNISPDPSNHSVEEIRQENGSIVRFAQLEGEKGPWTPVAESEGKWLPVTRVLAALEKTSEGWTFTRKKTAIFKFNTSGQLISESDLNGDATTLAYNSSHQLETVTDSGGRKIKFTYSGEHVTEVTDSDGRTVKYHYEEHGNLTEVTNTTGAVTKYGYDSAHHMTSVATPDGGTTKNTYDAEGRVITQTDPLGHTTTWSYNMEPSLSGKTTVTEPDGTVTLDSFTNGDLMTSTAAPQTSNEAMTQYKYEPTTNGRTSATEPNGNTTLYTYNKNGQRLSETTRKTKRRNGPTTNTTRSPR